MSVLCDKNSLAFLLFGFQVTFFQTPVVSGNKERVDEAPETGGWIYVGLGEFVWFCVGFLKVQIVSDGHRWVREKFFLRYVKSSIYTRKSLNKSCKKGHQELVNPSTLLVV